MESHDNSRVQENSPHGLVGSELQEYLNLFSNNKRIDLSDHNLRVIQKKALHYFQKIQADRISDHDESNELNKFNKNNYKLNKVISQKNNLTKNKEDFFLPSNQSEDIVLINNTIKSIQTLPQSLLAFEDLCNFQCCQILIHEKGSKYSESIFHDPTNKLNFTSLTSQQFTDVFNIIKKSKSKNFDQSKILSDLIGSVGTFLAKEVQLKNHNVIIIISRNDFLPPTKEEQVRFDSYVDFISPLIDKLLQKRQNVEKTNNLFLTLDNLPIPLTISDANKNIVFNNLTYKMEQVNEGSNLKKISLPIGGSYNLSLYVNTRDDLTDIQHFQRISLLGELLNTLQHELSNPLFGIKLTSELLEASNLETQNFLKEISTYSERCQNIIQNFSQIYQSDDDHTQINLETFINEILILTKSETRGIQKDLNISKNVDPTVTSNKGWLYHILFNLIVNASQAIKQRYENPSSGSISIEITSNNEDILVSISDNGVGIPEELKEKVLNPFFTTKEKGTGLGLSICQSLLKKMNSELRLTSQENIGTSFSFQIPRAKR